MFYLNAKEGILFKQHFISIPNKRDWYLMHNKQYLIHFEEVLFKQCINSDT